jgi:thiol-disulfide isomerase/thioredoxin
MRTLIITGLCALLLCGCNNNKDTARTVDTSRYTTNSLAVGDPAPPLDIQYVVLGKATRDFTPGTVYVVEFWATWCGPCRQSIPHLSALQEQHGDNVKIIGISDESPDKVRSFINLRDGQHTYWRNRITYCLGTDPDGSTWTHYFKAAGLSGIPSAFIVGPTGVIEWIGHPLAMDEPLQQVLDGTWDRNAFIDAQMQQAPPSTDTAEAQQS